MQNDNCCMIPFTSNVLSSEIYKERTYMTGCLGLGDWRVGGGWKWKVGGSIGKEYGVSFRVMKIF